MSAPDGAGRDAVHLERAGDATAAIDTVAARLADEGGGRVPLSTLLQDLDHRARRTWLPARAVHRAYAFDAADRRDERWWPQGVTTSADADPGERVEGRRLVAVAWYAKQLPGDPEGGQGSRVTVLDLDARRYRHVLLARVVAGEDGAAPRLAPLRVHAGGLVWHGPHLHVAATGRGFHTCHLEDLLRVPDALARSDAWPLAGYRYVLPVRFSYRARAGEDAEPLRYSFLSLDRSSDGDSPALVAGEYARGSQAERTRRLARFPLDPATGLLTIGPDGAARPVHLAEGVAQMQGAVVAHGHWHITTSHGPWTPGSVWTGTPGEQLHRHRWATPMGPEDISYWPGSDELWSVSEHPRRRWVFAMRRRWFERRHPRG